jgi:thiamine-phosphate pyrophosphorylase
MIQLRLKRAGSGELANLSRRLLQSISVPLIINDRLDVALAVGAQGVHLGPDDLPPDRARAIAPAGFLIGASVGSAVEATGAQAADYWGVGPWRATATKTDAGAALGPAGFAEIVALAGHHPCVAIGSVRSSDVPAVLGAGGVGIAVVSGVFGQPDIEAAARGYRID